MGQAQARNQPGSQAAIVQEQVQTAQMQVPMEQAQAPTVQAGTEQGQSSLAAVQTEKLLRHYRHHKTDRHPK